MTTQTAMPAWLRQHLIDLGHLTPGGISRRATWRRCTRCQVPILTGLDDDTAAMTVHADPHLLDPAGEATALLTGRATYRLRNRGGRLELDHRDHWQIRGDPAGTVPVLPAHACGQPLSGTWIHAAHATTTPPTDPQF